MKCEACSPRRDRPDRLQPKVLTLPASAQRPPGVLAPTEAKLSEAGCADTPEAALALHYARLIDEGDYNAQGAAALGKAWREAMTAALQARPAADALDELVRKRRERQSRGA